MAILHIENTVRDYDAWKAVFDKFERFRADHGVRAYRLTRSVAEPSQVTVDLDFDTAEEAVAFRGELKKIWRTPQSASVLADHNEPTVVELVVERQLSAR